MIAEGDTHLTKDDARTPLDSCVCAGNARSMGHPMEAECPTVILTKWEPRSTIGQVR